MDIPDPNQATEIARAYLKQLRESPGSGKRIQKPELQAWLELEKRLMLGSDSHKPKQASNRISPRKTAVNEKTKTKSPSIWKRPISDLFR